MGAKQSIIFIKQRISLVMNKIIYDIWLSCILTPGSDSYLKLRERFSDSEGVFSADSSELASVLTGNSQEYERISDKNLARAEEIYDFCRKYDVGIVAYDSPAFPESLKRIPSPPVLLYYRGVFPDFNSMFCVSVVGTRSLSKYGRRNAFNISHDLALSGATVVSGMAIGIDGVAAAGALSAGGITVAVLGSGIDVCYPMQHKMLAREIVKHGCVLTEFAPGTKPERYNFPRRNRIISGLSAATLVIEGRERSGALITARYAKEQGRAVYALPGNVENKNSEVSNLLLKNGARACTSADDIVRDFESEYPSAVNPFALSAGKRASLEESLKKYCVCATAFDDDIFVQRPKRRANAGKISNEPENHELKTLKVATGAAVSSAPSDAAELPNVEFDARTLGLYKKIPTKESCSIESLVDGEYSLRDVMRCLLKLEMGKFVKMLPGERVERNL